MAGRVLCTERVSLPGASTFLALLFADAAIWLVFCTAHANIHLACTARCGWCESAPKAGINPRRYEHHVALRSPASRGRVARSAYC